MTDHTFNRCEHPGCNRRVMAFKGYKLCLLHRGRPKYPRRKKSVRDREKEKAREKRIRDSAGVPWL